MVCFCVACGRDRNINGKSHSHTPDIIAAVVTRYISNSSLALYSFSDLQGASIGYMCSLLCRSLVLGRPIAVMSVCPSVRHTLRLAYIKTVYNLRTENLYCQIPEIKSVKRFLMQQLSDCIIVQ